MLLGTLRGRHDSAVLCKTYDFTAYSPTATTHAILIRFLKFLRQWNAPSKLYEMHLLKFHHSAGALQCVVLRMLPGMLRVTYNSAAILLQNPKPSLRTQFSFNLRNFDGVGIHSMRVIRCTY